MNADDQKDISMFWTFYTANIVDFSDAAMAEVAKIVDREIRDRKIPLVVENDTTEHSGCLADLAKVCRLQSKSNNEPF